MIVKLLVLFFCVDLNYDPNGNILEVRPEKGFFFFFWEIYVETVSCMNLSRLEQPVLI